MSKLSVWKLNSCAGMDDGIYEEMTEKRAEKIKNLFDKKREDSIIPQNKPISHGGKNKKSTG